MSDVDALTVLVRVVGLVATLLGTAAAVPGAVWRLRDKTAANLRALQARLSPRAPDRHVTLADLGAAVETSATGAITMAQSSTFMQRVAALEQRVTEIEGSVREVSDNLQVEIEARKDADTRLSGQIEGLRSALRDLEKVSTEVDARALPLVVLGIVLTGIGDWLASVTWLGVASIVLGAMASVYALIILARHRPS